MNKIQVNRHLIMGFIVAVFCFSFLFINTSAIISANNNSILTIKQGISAVQSSSDSTGNGWPMFRGNLNNTGLTETTPIRGTNSIWSNIAFSSTAIQTSAALANGLAYIGCSNGYVFCFNASNGATKWDNSTGDDYSTPAVANGFVYTAGTGYIFCLNATSGVISWHQDISGSSYIYSSPAVVNGMVYIGSGDDNIYCLNAGTGSQIWNFTTNGTIYSSPAVVNGMVYIGSNDHNVYCLNAATGSKIWNFTTNSSVMSSPAVSNGLVYVGSSDHNMYCLNASTGSLVWSYMTGSNIESSPSVAYGMIYFGSEDDNIYCLNAITGALVWNYTTPFQVDSSPAISNSMLYIGSADMNMYCFNAISGILLYNYAVNGGLYFMSPTIAYGRVYCVSNNNENLTCYPFYNGPPSPPLNFQAAPGENQVNLTWQSPSDNGGSPITYYKIFSGTSPENEKFLVEIGNVTNYIEAGLLSNTTYYYTISAINKYGEGLQSAEINATTISLTNSTSTNGKLTIGGMSVGAISLVTSIGVIFAVISVKKRLK